MPRGKLIVISGTDGAGKATQSKLLVDRLKEEGQKVKLISFPRYGESSAIMVERYLAGGFGEEDKVGPYQASTYYAFDRAAAAQEINDWLDAGAHLISNRYVSANKGHQLGKITDPTERDRFLDWLNWFEYDCLGVVKEDVNILLYLAPEIGQRRAEERANKEMQNKVDIHEASIDHLRRAAEAYLYVAKREGWHVIDCAPNGIELIEEVIHAVVYRYVQKVLSNVN